MYSAQCVLGLMVLYLGCTHSWDVAISVGNRFDFYTNDTKTDTVRLDSHDLGALAYDEVHDILLYVDKQRNNDAICGYGISSKLNQCFTKRNGRNIHSIFFDPATELLYFSDTNERSIYWISLSFETNIQENLLIKMDKGIPTDIVVDSCRGYIYWINTNLASPIIERMRVNGTEREVIITSTSLSINSTYKLEPHALIIDPQIQKIYWIEPWSTYNIHYIRYADLDGKNISELEAVFLDPDIRYSPSNTLSVSKTNLYGVDWYYDGESTVRKIGKIEWTGYSVLFDLEAKNVSIGVVANYKTKEEIQNIDDCNALQSFGRKNCDEPTCDACDGYCSNNGHCSSNDDGRPQCRCNAGYSGERCEVAMCLDYCLNDGLCYLNEKQEPSCECVYGYGGSRCETFLNLPTSTTTTSTTTEKPFYYSPPIPAGGVRMTLMPLHEPLGK